MLPAVDAVMMLRVQRERMSGGYFPTPREYTVGYGLTRSRLAALRPGTPICHPGPMNRGLEISAEAADAASSLVLNQVAAGVAVRMAVLYELLGGADEMPLTRVREGSRVTELVITGADLVGDGAGDLYVRDGVFADPAEADADVERIDADGPGRPARVGRPAHAPARTRTGGRRDGRDRHPGGGPRRLHRGAGHGQHDPVTDTAEAAEHLLVARPAGRRRPRWSRSAR